MLVMVSTPRAVVKVWPTAVMATPLSEIEVRPSGAWKTIEPVVVSLLAAEFDPAGSEPRAGRPASLTEAVASTAPAGWSGVIMIVVTGRSIFGGMISCARGSGKASSV